MHAAIYARVSSDKQRDEQTIQSQRAELLQWATELGASVPAEWEFIDDGYSGGSLIRPGLERLRDLVAEGVIQRVLIHGPDRLAREYAHQVLLLEEFRQAGAEVLFRKAPSGDTPEDQLVVQFQGMIAQYERAQILERSRRGKRHKALRGVASVLSGAPYGFRYVRKSDTCEARYEVEPLEAEIVRLMFRWFVTDQWSLGRIARELTSRAVLTRCGKTRWDRSVIWGMLRNPAYIGRAAFRKTQLVQRKRINRSARLRRLYPRRANSSPRARPREEWIEIPVPQIIESEVFEQAQRQLQRNKSLARRGAPVLLRGLLVCRGCSHSLYATSASTSKQKLYYYRCLGTDGWRYPEGARCQNPPLRADRLDNEVWGHVLQLLESPELVQREISKRFDDVRTEKTRRGESTQAVEAQLAKVDKSIARLLDAYQEELIDLDALRTRMRQLKSKRTELDHTLRQAALEAASEQDYVKLADDVSAFTAKLRKGSPLLALEDRQRVLRALVREVVVDVDRVVVRHCIPIKPGSTPPGYQRRWGRHDASLWGAEVDAVYLAVLHHPGLQPFIDRAAQHSIDDPLVEKCPKMGEHQGVEERLDIHVEHRASVHRHQSPPERNQRLVSRAFGPESVREVPEILLVNRVQHHRDRPLQDLVLERRDPDRSGFSVALWNVDPPNRRCAVGTGLESVE